jgi:hypothetical protein
MSRATQIEFRPSSRGFVDVFFTHASAHQPQQVYVLQYPQSGQMVGEPSIDHLAAERLNEAARSLNEALQALSS